MKVIAFSGGKDSTAMAFRMWQRGEQAQMLFTPAGNEPPELFEHVKKMNLLTGFPLATLKAPTLMELIQAFKALPNHRQRWCTRMIKIMPAIAWLKSQTEKPTLCIGLRADEPLREGMYGDQCDYCYPLREWGWGLRQVTDSLAAAGITVPVRTNCMLCYGQRIGEWYALWRDNRQAWNDGETIEAEIGRTFRSPSRDTWPAAMKDLRDAFEGGRIPKQRTQDCETACRVCTL